MQAQMQAELDEVARRHGVGPETARALFDALVAGGGTMAQFSIPELGGMGQWSQGGMTMVGSMFDQGLKARVAALCSDLAPLARGATAPGHEAAQAPASAHAGSAPPAPAAGAGWPAAVGQAQSQVQGAGQPAGPLGGGQGGGGWWPAELGSPSSSGAQNDMRYAYFPDARRLAVQQDGRLSLYDTGEHRISGVSQQQGGTRSLAFTGQHGPVSLDALRRVETGESRPAPPSPAPAGSGAPASPPAPAPARAASSGADDPLATIERLAELRQRGILTDEEFAAAKAEQLRRL